MKGKKKTKNEEVLLNLKTELQSKGKLLNNPKSLASESGLTIYLTLTQVGKLEKSSDSRSLCNLLLQRFFSTSKVLAKFSRIEIEYMSQSICKFLAQSLGTELKISERHFGVNLLLNLWLNQDPRTAQMNISAGIFPQKIYEKCLEGYISWVERELQTLAFEEFDWVKEFTSKFKLLADEYESAERNFTSLNVRIQRYDFALMSENFSELSDSIQEWKYEGVESAKKKAAQILQESGKKGEESSQQLSVIEYMLVGQPENIVNEAQTDNFGADQEIDSDSEIQNQNNQIFNIQKEKETDLCFLESILQKNFDLIGSQISGSKLVNLSKILKEIYFDKFNLIQRLRRVNNYFPSREVCKKVSMSYPSSLREYRLGKAKKSQIEKREGDKENDNNERNLETENSIFEGQVLKLGSVGFEDERNEKVLGINFISFLFLLNLL